MPLAMDISKSFQRDSHLLQCHVGLHNIDRTKNVKEAKQKVCFLFSNAKFAVRVFHTLSIQLTFLNSLFGLLAPEMPLPPLQQPELLLGIKHLAHFPRQGHRIDGLAG